MSNKTNTNSLNINSSVALVMKKNDTLLKKLLDPDNCQLASLQLLNVYLISIHTIIMLCDNKLNALPKAKYITVMELSLSTKCNLIKKLNPGFFNKTSSIKLH